MSRVPSLTLNECLNELLREEQSQITKHTLKQQSSGDSLDVVYVATKNRSPATSQGPVRGSIILFILQKDIRLHEILVKSNVLAARIMNIMPRHARTGSAIIANLMDISLASKL